MQRTSRAMVRFTLILLGALFVATVCQAAGHEGTKESEDVAIKAVDAFIEQQKVDKDNPGWKTSLPKPPKVEFDASHSYFWNLDTNVGNVKIKLLPEVAPMHASSTIYLTRLGFYDDTVFHRVITGFMAQGGDPLGRGTGGPGYKYDGEYDRSVKHDKPGLLSMANAGPGTDGSQFFLTFVPTPWLDGKHTLFGEVVEGMGTVKDLEKYGSQQGKPSKKLMIEKATITVE
jgi:peptidyl-prolyl cis-trans isomerase B (cyclophilin B)